MKEKAVLMSNLRILLAIEILEYEEKNHLSGNSKSRSEVKQSLLNHSIEQLHNITPKRR